MKSQLGKWLVVWASLIDDISFILTFCYWNPRLFLYAVDYFYFKKKWVV